MMKAVALSSNFKKTIHISGVVLGYVVLFFVFLELAARFYLFGSGAFNIFKMDSCQAIGLTGVIQVSPNPEIGYELKPNVHTYVKWEKFETSSRGLRDREYPFEKSPHTFRAVILGASITKGIGLKRDDVFDKVLERNLNADDPTTPHEFINFAVSGYDILQCLAVLKYRALKYHPDLILLIFPCEKLYRHPYHFKPKPRAHCFFESYFLRIWDVKISKRIREAMMRGKPWLREKFRWERQHRHDGRSRPKKPRHPGHRRPTIFNNPAMLEDVFSELGRISKKTGIPICIALEPFYRNTFEDAWNTAEGYGLYTIRDFRELNSDKFRRKMAINILDKHLNARAHRIIAQVIYEYLKDHHLLDRRPGRPLSAGTTMPSGRGAEK